MTKPSNTTTESPSLHQALWLDAKRTILVTIFGVLAVVLADYIITLIVFPGQVEFFTAIRLLFLEITLSLVLLAKLLPFTVFSSVTSRLLYFFYKKEHALSWRGLFGPTSKPIEASAIAPRIWAIAIATVGFLAGSTLLTLKLSVLFKEPQLTALAISFTQLSLACISAVLAFILSLFFRRIGRTLHPFLGICNPLGSVPASLLMLTILLWPLSILLFKLLPQLAPYLEWRHIFSAVIFTAAAYLATRLSSPAGLPEPIFLSTKTTRKIWIVSVVAMILITPLTLFVLGAQQDTKSLAISSSPLLAQSINTIRKYSDFDKDGFGSLLGENDCAPFDDKIHPLARDIPDNGIDENCDGKDFKIGILPSYQKNVKMPVPKAFQNDWNFLLITIDTVRYDHTTMGGYKRNTTPRLNEFAARSANFSFANAPSAGTMASIPSIITSKFFHSGIALDNNVSKGPPRLKKSNTLLSELFKAKGYRTGAILSHEYFNDWGMNQGVDDYDNTVGKKRAPRKVTSQLLTERSIAWIGKQKKKKWFLWTHYIDPHGYYVSHPGEKSYGETEMDLYDGELHFTDKYIARLLDYIARSPGGNKTIIAITSDHGDAFGEHGYINHAQDLHQELIHVPLIFYIPNIEPRDVPGTVSPMDIFPTFADLIGSDITHLNIEGQSLVPQLFYKDDALDRIVFSETNYPKPLRAVINSRYKLILDLKNNVSRLWNLKKDPLEKKNIWTKDKEGYKEMRGYLNEWIERVVYARDTHSNQAIEKLQKYLVTKLPKDTIPIEGVSLDNNTIEIIAYKTSNLAPKPGEKLKIHIYFRSKKTTTVDFRFQIESWLSTEVAPTRVATSRMKLTGGGMLPSSRWHSGEIIQEEFQLRVPTSWNRKDTLPITFGLRFQAKDSKNTGWTGPIKEGKKDLVIIGSLNLGNPIQDPKKPSPAPLPLLATPNKEKKDKTD